MLDEIPQRWVENGPSNGFKGEAQKNEYYTFQLGVFAAQQDLSDLKLVFAKVSSIAVTVYELVFLLIFTTVKQTPL